MSVHAHPHTDADSGIKNRRGTQHTAAHRRHTRHTLTPAHICIHAQALFEYWDKAASIDLGENMVIPDEVPAAEVCDVSVRIMRGVLDSLGEHVSMCCLCTCEYVRVRMSARVWFACVGACVNRE